MKKRKIFIKSIILIIFISIVLISNIKFNNYLLDGNPEQKKIAAEKINDYVNANYADMNLNIGETKFNSKFGEYYSNVYSNEDIDVHFFVRYVNEKIDDDYEMDVLSGWNTTRRMEEEYAKLITPLLKEEFSDLFDRVTVEYPKKITKTDIATKLNQPLDINDGEYKKLWLHLKDADMTVYSLSSNLRKMHNILTKKGYYIDEYGVWIYGDEHEYVNVIGVKVDMVDDGLTELIQYSKDNTEEAFQKYGINTHFKE